MLEITVPGDSFFDEIDEVFTTIGDVTLQLEHSLVSVSKWESEFKKPFLAPGEKTTEETVGYIRCMILTPDVAPEVFLRLSEKNFEQINEYIEDKMTATWFNETPDAAKSSTEAITAELIYYWLVSFNIPFEVERWHLNRLLTLVKICGIKNQKPTKMGRESRAAQMRRLNEQRKAELGTKG